MKSLKLIPITQLIDMPEEVAVSPEHLEVATLSDLPRNITLLTKVDLLKVTIRKDIGLSVEVSRKVAAEEPVAQQHGVETVSKMVVHASGFVPENKETAKGLPKVTSASWTLPDEASWRFDLAATATGAQVLAAVRTSNEFIKKTTESLLAPSVSS